MGFISPEPSLPKLEILLREKAPFLKPQKLVPFDPNPPSNGVIFLDGTLPESWSRRVLVRDGKLVKILGQGI